MDRLLESIERMCPPAKEVAEKSKGE